MSPRREGFLHSCIIPADVPQTSRKIKPLCRRCFLLTDFRPAPLVPVVLPCLRHITAACGFAGTGAFFRRTMKKRGMVVVFNNIYYLYAQVVG